MAKEETKPLSEQEMLRAEGVKKNAVLHAQSFVNNQKWLHQETGGRHGHPNPGKAEFEAFIAKCEEQYKKNNPTMWPAVQEELEAALKTF